MARDYKCPPLPEHDVEYMVLQSHTTRGITGYIPRSCMEAAGVDTSRFSPTNSLWWTKAETQKMRAHKHFVTPEQWDERERPARTEDDLRARLTALADDLDAQARGGRSTAAYQIRALLDDTAARPGRRQMEAEG